MSAALAGSTGRRSRRGWGWHRLADEWAAQVVADAKVRPGELVLDLGAGEGALTRHLIAAGARVVAVEAHPGRAAFLRRRYAGRAPGVTVVEADATALPLPRRPFRVVASPPYAISSRLLRLLLAPGSRLVAADLVLQTAMVRRYADGSAPGARRLGRRWRLAGGRPIPRQAFRPAPRVDSAVLVVRRRLPGAAADLGCCRRGTPLTGVARGGGFGSGPRTWNNRGRGAVGQPCSLRVVIRHY